MCLWCIPQCAREDWSQSGAECGKSTGRNDEVCLEKVAKAHSISERLSTQTRSFYLHAIVVEVLLHLLHTGQLPVRSSGLTQSSSLL